jgi:transposase-like protein
MLNWREPRTARRSIGGGSVARTMAWLTGNASVFAGFRFPREVIAVAVRWHLRDGLSYRDVKELLAERNIWVEAARACLRLPGDRWFVDETYVKVSGGRAYVYRAIDQLGQAIHIMVSTRRDLAAARRFCARALAVGVRPVEVTTDRGPAYRCVLDEQLPAALHAVDRYANNPVEADHSRLKARRAGCSAGSVTQASVGRTERAMLRPPRTCCRSCSKCPSART